MPPGAHVKRKPPQAELLRASDSHVLGIGDNISGNPAIGVREGGLGVIDRDKIRAFAARLLRKEPDCLRIRVSRLLGGLQAPAVAKVSVDVEGPAPRRRAAQFVIKCASGTAHREVAAYRMLDRHLGGVAPRLLGAEEISPGATCLYLEWVDNDGAWPWARPDSNALAMETLAWVHSSLPASAFPAALAAWDYDRELVESAETTLEAFAAAARHEDFAKGRRRLRLLERIVSALPAIRRQLLGGRPVVLHGDAHSGNVIISARGRSRQAVFIDWVRVRLGSAFEDVCSWLQSLRYWEWETRRRHDTLLRRYLAARGMRDRLDSGVRERYWLAGASNALAGALRYHASFIHDGHDAATRAEHARAALDWLRILRRAHACWKR
jgi:aminoglycoside phosphotransferase (APT) family kinase protein